MGLIETNGIKSSSHATTFRLIPFPRSLPLRKSRPNGLIVRSCRHRQHLLTSPGELLKAQAGIPLSGIPYRGTAAVLTDLIAGQVDLCFVGISGRGVTSMADR